jgi:hypothetical protein
MLLQTEPSLLWWSPERSQGVPYVRRLLPVRLDPDGCGALYKIR